MFDIRGQQNACDVFTVSFEVGDWNQLRLFTILSKVPYKHIALLKWLASVHLFTGKSPTELVPAQRVDPSLATVTLATDMSSSGIS